MAGARQRADAAVPSARSELRSVEAKIGKAEQALERYFNAFESGTLTGRRFASRIDELEARLAELRRRREEIQDELERETVREPSQADLRGVINAIDEAMENGNPSQRKALLQELVAEIRVESREAIFPTYRLPNGPVRVISGVVGRRGLEPRTSAVIGRERCAYESGSQA